jgi:hypothetical protein
MKIAYTAVAVCALAFAAPAFAHDDDHDAPHEHEGVVHYEVETPATNDAALKLIEEKATQVGAVLANANLDSNQLESVHEYTYSIEVAVSKLRGTEHNDATEEALDAVDEANQAIHYAAENHKEDAVREWFPKLQPGVDALVKAYQPTEATPAAIEE